MMFVLVLLAVLVALLAAGMVWASRRAEAEGHARGRREAELEAAAATEVLRGRADDLAQRLASAEARLQNAEQVFRKEQEEKGGLQVVASRVPVLEGEVRALKARIEMQLVEIQNLSGRNAALDAQLQEIRAREPQVREALQRELAQFLQEKGQDFSRQNTETLETILNPLRERLKDFEKKVEDSHKEGRDRHVELKTQIEGLLGMNRQLSQEAQNLASALKGENKASGNWGEIVLERVLEMSGLERGREYEVQQGYTNEDGQRKLPDAVVHLPERRHLVIDSKVSLVAYDRYCSAGNPEDAAAELQAHIQSVRQHVRNLAEQRYQDLPGLRSPDFVFLFMPVEPAFILAVKEEPQLFQQAFERNIVIVSPSTLLATLRTVANIWKQEYRSRNAEEIARLGGALYDKFVGFLEDLNAVGDGLSKAQDRFEEARKKLRTGKGNLIGSVERLRIQGAKAKKQIPEGWQEADPDAGDDDGDAPALPLGDSQA